MVVVDKFGVIKLVPVANDVPPVAAAYQLIVPEEAVAPNVTDPASHREAGVVAVIVGIALITKFVAVLQLPSPGQAA